MENTQKVTTATNIKEWYMAEYPTDDMGVEIDETITFNGVIGALNERKEIYEYLGVCDSVIRERIFTKLSEVMNVQYDDVYITWLKFPTVNKEGFYK